MVAGDEEGLRPQAAAAPAEEQPKGPEPEWGEIPASKPAPADAPPLPPSSPPRSPKAADSAKEESGVGGAALDPALPPTPPQKAPEAAKPEAETSVQVTVPNSLVGLVIGRHGEKVRSLQEQTGATVWVSSYEAPEEPGAGSGAKARVMEIRGPPDVVEAAEKIVKDSLEALKHAPDGSTQRTEQCLSIPSKSVGMIIGRGGEVVKRIQQVSRARIQIQTDSATPPGAKERLVWIWGTPEEKIAARQVVDDLLSGRITTAALLGQAAFPMGPSPYYSQPPAYTTYYQQRQYAATPPVYGQQMQGGGGGWGVDSYQGAPSGGYSVPPGTAIYSMSPQAPSQWGAPGPTGGWPELAVPQGPEAWQQQPQQPLQPGFEQSTGGYYYPPPPMEHYATSGGTFDDQ